MLAEDLSEERDKLIESLGVYLEKERLIAPLAARIFSTLVINGSDGTTFEQLVNDLGASKSTIFTHLTTLEAQQKITYFTKCGDRKRYYYVIPGYISRKIRALVEEWQNEKKLQEKILIYKKKFNRIYPDHQSALTEHELIIDFLSRFINTFEDLDKQYKKIENKNNSDR